jgi:hypothetical protein
MKNVSFKQRRIIALSLILLVIVLVAVIARAKTTSSQVKITPPTPTPSVGASPSPTPTQAGAGSAKGRGPGESPSPSATTVTPTPASSLQKPIGEVLNKSAFSLSAAASDSQHNANMVSTVISAAPGSTNTIIAVGPNGTAVKVGAPVTADANGQGGEIPWNAKASGLTVGEWQVHILSQQGNSSNVSDAEKLTVGN